MNFALPERYLAAKRKLFDKLYRKLNDRQREAVFAVNGPILVFAGAGSGKTTVLVNRVAQIIRYGNAYESDRIPENLSLQTVEGFEECIELEPEELKAVLDEFAVDPCPPWAVMAITFTNKAANEIKERLASIFGDSGMADSVWAGTFHSICMRIIRSHPAEAGVAPGVTIYDTDDQKKVLTSVLKEMDVDEKQFTPKSCAAAIGRAKEQLMTPAQYERENGHDFSGKVFSTVYSRYQERLTESNAMDFDDIIMRTVLMLRENSEIRRSYANKFRYICVDEFQDTDPAQFELVKLLGSGRGNIMAVGDDDQSIYRFRGATVENILGYADSFSGTRVIKLEQNYRSTSTILGAANAVISKNKTRAEKKLWTDKGDGEKIILETCESEEAEAVKITDIIRTSVAKGEYHFRDFAILYRVNAQSNAIERTFSRSGIPYRVFGGQRFNDRKEIKDVTAYLQIIANPADSVRLRRIINEPKRKIGDATMEAVAAIADETGSSMLGVMEHAEDFMALARVAQKLKDFTGVINSLRDIYAGGCPLDAFIGQVLDRTGYRQMLIDGGEAEKDRLDNVNEYISNAIEYMRNEDSPTLEGFLERNSLVADVDKYDEDADAAVMMTVHSAKGLEFPVVILPGMEETVFPSGMSLDDPAEMDEERRLAYVAITRAQKRLYILCTKMRVLYARTTYNKPSRFIGDIPEKFIDNRTPESLSGRNGRGSYSDYPSRYQSGGYGYGDGGRRRSFDSIFDDDDGYTPSYTYSPPAKSGGGRIAAPKSYAATVSAGKAKAASPSEPTEVFSAGDRVLHSAFGEGTILSAKQMGNDSLYEIAFDTVGTKKLMAKYAKLKKA
ncbi:MAG: UvrD-helicase domain-containing protein [Clostridia bacterium]|nr:UvrD-helicase domain-containing protein [Clostridia bacterium]